LRAPLEVEVSIDCQALAKRSLLGDEACCDAVPGLAVTPVLLPRFAAAQAPLQPVAKRTMPASAQGRFDHLGIEEKDSRLFVAAESRHQVLVFDLKSGK
jgi:hypothetical protein